MIVLLVPGEPDADAAPRQRKDLTVSQLIEQTKQGNVSEVHLLAEPPVDHGGARLGQKGQGQLPLSAGHQVALQKVLEEENVRSTPRASARAPGGRSLTGFLASCS